MEELPGGVRPGEGDLVKLSTADGVSDLPPSGLVIERGRRGIPELCAAMNDSLPRTFSRA